ncbi:MAG: hypothetical protein ACPGN3_13760 [Opitutales bacterium]
MKTKILIHTFLALLTLNIALSETLTVDGDLEVTGSAKVPNVELTDAEIIVGTPSQAGRLVLGGPNQNQKAGSILFEDNTFQPNAAGVSISWNSDKNNLEFIDHWDGGSSVDRTIMVLDRDSGRLGIGTADPTKKLDVDGETLLRDRVQLLTGANSMLLAPAGNNRFYFAPRKADDTNWAWDEEFGFNSETRAWAFDTALGVGTVDPDAKLHVVGDSILQGWLGVGTTTPKKTFHVTGDSYFKGHVFLHAFEGDGNSGTAYLQARDDSGSSDIGLQIRTQKDGVVERAIHIVPEGDVGIGTYSPSAKLDVAGNVQVDGDSTVEGNMTVNGAIIITNPAGDIPMFGQ